MKKEILLKLVEDLEIKLPNCEEIVKDFCTTEWRKELRINIFENFELFILKDEKTIELYVTYGNFQITKELLEKINKMLSIITKANIEIKGGKC